MKSVLSVFLLTCFVAIFQGAEYCPGLHLDSIALSTTCIWNGRSRYSFCNRPMKEGTVVKISCANGYEKKNADAEDKIFCNAGKWDYEPIHCEPICGVFDLNSTTIPWHALIHVGDRKCGGAIISEKLVISAAHCFWDETHKKLVDKSNVKVTGHWKNFHLSISNGSVAEIYITNRFKAGVEMSGNEIAIIVLNGYIQYSTSAAAICISGNEQPMSREFNGFIPIQREISVEEITSLYNYSNCELVNVSNDGSDFKLSCKYSDDNANACLVNIGEGYVSPKILNGVKTYFLSGIVSNAVNKNTACFVTITSIEHHSAIILENMRTYPTPNVHSNDQCQVPFIPKLEVFVVEGNNDGKRKVSPGTSIDSFTKVAYNCESNHRLLGTKTNFCYTNSWGENHPVCIETAEKETTENITLSRFDCKLPRIPNVSIFDYYKHQQIPGNVIKSLKRIKYECKKNYHLVGPLDNFCLHNEWHNDHPTCIEISTKSLFEGNCEIPFLPYIVLENTMRKNLSFGNFVESGNSIIYRCPENYVLHGVTSNYCNEGAWLAEHPVCINIIISTPTNKDCEVQEISNGITVFDIGIRGNISAPIYVRPLSVIFYRCKKNFQLRGEPYNTCINGMWEFERHPRCIKIVRNGCEVPAIPNLVVVLQGEVRTIVSSGNYVENFSIVSYKCKANHLLLGRRTNNCIEGNWTDEHPKCTRFCTSDHLNGVTFSAVCEFENVRVPCNQPYLRIGTIAKIICQYGYRKPDPFVRDIVFCDNSGNWDYKPFRCEPLCGREQTEVVPYIKGGNIINITTVTWHAGIYSSLTGKYVQFCGGTIISANLVLSAAHCFWNSQISTLDKSYVSVAVGKYYRDYYTEEPLDAQYFNVSEIYIPEGFQGPIQSFHDDIAILVLIGFIEYKPHIMPICIERLDLEARAVQSGIIGRVAGWGKTSRDLPSQKLKMLETSTLSYSDCIRSADARYRSYIAADKFCISSDEDESVCPGDSGGGFVIPQVINEVETYFLWGIVSNAPTNRTDCKSVTLTTLTNIHHYQDLILLYEKKYGAK